MAKIYNTSGKLFTINSKGERVKVDQINAPVNDCDTGIFGCGDNSYIQFKHQGTIKQIKLIDLYNKINTED